MSSLPFARRADGTIKANYPLDIKHMATQLWDACHQRAMVCEGRDTKIVLVIEERRIVIKCVPKPVPPRASDTLEFTDGGGWAGGRLVVPPAS